MSYRVGILGTGAVAHKHAQAYRNIGYEVAACSAREPDHSKRFAEQYGCENCDGWQAVCRHPRVEFVDVCTLPDFRLEAVQLCAELGKAVLVEKPIAANLETAQRMLDTRIALGVVSQHRFDESSQFLKRAIEAGRLGRILQADAYVKWHRPAAYYARPGKGTWAVEGGGALITQAIHQADLLLWLAGPVRHVYGEWQVGATHQMESEDIVNAVLRYGSGATGVIQAATSFQPGQPERVEIHGTRGTAVITGDRLTHWQAEGEEGEPAPVAGPAASGASDPMAISLAPFERQFLDFGEAIRTGRTPLVSGVEGYRALEVVTAIYRSCREGRRVVVAQGSP